MAENWNSLSERGSYFWVLLAAWMYKVLGRRVTLALLAPVIFFYYLNGRQQRRACQQPLTCVIMICGGHQPASNQTRHHYGCIKSRYRIATSAGSM